MKKRFDFHWFLADHSFRSCFNALILLSLRIRWRANEGDALNSCILLLHEFFYSIKFTTVCKFLFIEEIFYRLLIDFFFHICEIVSMTEFFDSIDCMLIRVIQIKVWNTRAVFIREDSASIAPVVALNSCESSCRFSREFDVTLNTFYLCTYFYVQDFWFI